jgi:putative restriction endonuclease
VRAFVGVTDTDWYRFLAVRPQLSEVNFWRPSGRGFHVITTGEPFLFKTHAPHNRLVGGGFLSSSTQLRLSEAWDFFADGNGVSSLDAFRSAVAKYRRQPLTENEDPLIGCVLLRDVFFARPEDSLPPPSDWSPNLVSGKKYDLETSSALESAISALIASSEQMQAVPGPMFGDPRLTVPRLGQQAFKALVLTAYQRRCAITGARIAPTLQAAHIRPVAQGGEHRLDNGLLLRSDVHIMFDRGYLGVDDKLRLHVSPRLRDEFGNGEDFYARSGESLVSLPTRRVDRPNREALTWHMDTLFKSA